MKMQKRWELVRTDHCVGIRMIAEDLNVDRKMVRQILTTNLNVKKYVRNWSHRIHQFVTGKQVPVLIHTPYSPELALCDFSKNWSVCSEEPIFSQLKTSTRKWQHYFKHFHKMTSGDALRPNRLIWGSV